MGARVVGYRWARHPYEEGEWKFIQKILRPGMTFIDIGANQGFYTILGARSVMPGGIVYAFEPAPPEARKLRANLRLNGAKQVVVEERALGAAVGNADFYLCHGHQGSWSSLRVPAADVTARVSRIEVGLTTLDTYLADKDVSESSVMKIDVEGGELAVLQGSQGVLQQRRPIVLCEALSVRTYQWGYDVDSLLNFVVGFDYEWFSVVSDGRLHRRQPNREETWNLAAVPRERVPMLGDHLEV
jgi:FkbM family methyltransferase